MNPFSLALATVAVVCSLVALCAPAKAGVYTTTYTTPDGRMYTCTTITDFYGNPLSVNCIGG